MSPDASLVPGISSKKVMKILAVSDRESPLIYSPNIKTRFDDIDIVLSCGDLSYFYLEYMISSLDIPLYFVRGNHAVDVEYGVAGTRTAPWGGIDLHKKVIRDKQTGLILAGIEGSLKYNDRDYQYSQLRMWWMVLQLIPSLIINRIRYGRFLDIFVTHAPPLGIHDQKDRPHKGILAFKWFDKLFHPTYHLHGHIHIYKPGTVRETDLGDTKIINAFAYRIVKFQFPTAD